MTTKPRTVLKGAVAGALATVPMSVVMLGAQRLGLMGEQPPEAITEKALAAANRPANWRTVQALSVASHFAFGAAAGAAFALLSDDDDEPRALAVAKGVGFGLAVYGVSYAGWIPALGILPPPAHDRKGRQPSMVAAHVVYGAALALLIAEMND